MTGVDTGVTDRQETEQLPPSAAPAAPPDSPAPETLVRGIAWTGAVKWSVQIVTWLSTVIVARLLTPEDYGLVGMATIYMGFITYLSEFGIGTTIVTLRDLRDEQVAQLNSLALILGSAGVLLSFALAQPLARFFDAPQLTAVVMVMSAGFAITAFAAVPMALLQRELRFKLLALIAGAKALLMALSMVALAFLGFRYWTLVIGSLLGTGLSAVLILRNRRFAFARPRRETLRRPLEFTRHIITSRMAWYWYTTSDFVVAGRMLGKGPLGAYTIAWELANMIPAKITDMVSRVTPSFFSAVQADHAALRRYLLTLTEGISLLTFPATIGLALVAGDFIPLVLGEQWGAAVLPLQILGFYAALRSITPLLHQVLVVTGQESFEKWNTLAAAILLPIAFVIGSRWGGAGIAAGWLAVHPLILSWAFRRTFMSIGLRTRDYLRALQPAITGCAAIVLAVTAVMAAAPADWPSGVRLAAQVATGVTVYPLVLILLHRDRLQRMTKVFSMLRAPR